MNRYLSLLTAIVLSFAIQPASAAPGDLTLFNPDLGGYATSSVVLPDGTVYISGQFFDVGEGIARYLPNGAFDSSFNPDNNNICEKLYVQFDNQVLITGFFTEWGAGQSFERIVRIDADGNHDMSFNPSPNGVINAILQQDDGKLIVAGDFTEIAGEVVNRIARLNTDGSFDDTFDVGEGAADEVKAIAFQDDGKILLAGDFTSVDGTARSGFARLNADGSHDTDYAPGFQGTKVFSITKQPNGKLLVCGHFNDFTMTAPDFLVRLNADGSLDTSFTFNPTGFGTFAAVPQVNGKILLWHNLTKIDDIDIIYLSRLNADGSLDTAFNYMNFDNSSGHVAVIKDSGYLVLGGNFTIVNGTERNRAAEVEYETTTDEISVSSDGKKLLWTRSGNNAVVHRVRFEISTDGGTTWTPQGFASRVGATSTWELGGLSLPAGEFMARASGYIGHGSGLGSTSSGYSSEATLTKPVDNSALRKQLLKKIKKLVKKVKRFRRAKKAAKVKRLRKKIRKLGKRLRRL